MQYDQSIPFTPWEKRRLAFGRSTDELPVLLERVLGTAARLTDLTAHEPLERLSLRRQGSWSVMEHIGHMIFLQDRMDERVDDYAAQRSCLCRIELSDQEKILEGYTSRALGDVLEEFRLKRVYFVERIQGLDPGALRHRAQHPCRAERMTVADMVLYLAEHDDHHLVLMRKLLQGNGQVMGAR
jgi:hypothetical protein